MNNVVLKKVEGNTELIDNSVLLAQEINHLKAVHKCWENCKYAYANQCEKIFDQYKRTIDEYEFITDGWQIYDAEGMLDTFIITGCSQYKTGDSNKINFSDRDLLEKVYREVKYGNGSDKMLDECYELQYKFSQNGKLNEEDRARVLELKKETMKNPNRRGH